jgi:N-acetylglutamate synthase-like GNAT family acetyltransferase
MDIRTATSSDLEKIAELYVKNHTETYRGLLSDAYFERLTLDYAKEKWRTYLYSAGKKIWVAYREDEFLGFTAGMKDESLADVWYLDSLHITQKSRGKGIGTAFIKTMMKSAVENSYSKITEYTYSILLFSAIFYNENNSFFL